MPACVWAVKNPATAGRVIMQLKNLGFTCMSCRGSTWAVHLWALFQIAWALLPKQPWKPSSPGRCVGHSTEDLKGQVGGAFYLSIFFFQRCVIFIYKWRVCVGRNQRKQVSAHSNGSQGAGGSQHRQVAHKCNTLNLNVTCLQLGFPKRLESCLTLLILYLCGLAGV